MNQVRQALFKVTLSYPTSYPTKPCILFLLNMGAKIPVGWQQVLSIWAPKNNRSTCPRIECLIGPFEASCALPPLRSQYTNKIGHGGQHF
jgi:hypothetical protein